MRTAEPPRHLDPVPGATPDAEELCRIHELTAEMIDKSDDLDALLGRILEEYERRLRELPADALRPEPATLGEDARKKLHALVMFARQAAALKTRAEAASELRRHAERLEDANLRLTEALGRAERMHRWLDAVLGTINVGILIVGEDHRVRQANPAAQAMLGGPGIVGGDVAPLLRGVPPESDGEIVRELPRAGRRLLAVARRHVAPGSRSEVVLLNDLTERYREIEERQRLKSLAESMRTLGLLCHQINNPLTSVLGRAQVPRMKKGADPDVLKAALVIEESAQRAADLVRELARVVKDGREQSLEQLLGMVQARQRSAEEPDGSRPG
jgi:PAS domain-containing protein